MKIAVVTGASSGIGREFVLAVDRTYAPEEIWVIARNEKKLSELASLTQARIRPLALDLTQKESLAAYEKALADFHPDVCALVCASGFGRFGAFADLSLEDQMEMVDLNVKALMGVTYATLPYLHAGAHVYEMGSLSSFQPVPYIGVYGATKAFVLSFSRAIGQELRPKGIRVMAVSPFWVKTAFFDRAVSDDTITYYSHFYTPQQVVSRAISDMRRGRDVSICGFAARAQVLLTKLLPHKLIMFIWRKQQKKP